MNLWLYFPQILFAVYFSFALEYFCVYIYRSQCLLMALGLNECSSFFLAVTVHPPGLPCLQVLLNVDQAEPSLFSTLFLQQVVDVFFVFRLILQITAGKQG